MSGISKNLKKHIEQKTLRRKGYTYIWKLMRFVLLVGLSFMILYPVFVKFSASLKSTADMMDSTVVFIPKNPTLQNYKIVLNSVNYALTLLMTVLFCLVQSLLQLASCSLVAYGIARFKFKGHKLLFGMAVLTLIIPPQIILLPLYIRFHFFGITNIFQFSGIFSGVDLINTYWPFLLLSGTALGFKNGLYIYLLRQHFKNMPMALEEAAYIDGCGPFRTFLRIMLPGSVPMLVTVFLFSFVWQWNDTVYSGIFFPEIPTLANKLYGMVFTTMGAGTTLMSAVLESPKFFLLITPIVILYLFTQKLFVQSISRSGIVG
jgi:ABC transporter, permease protein